MKVDPKKIAGQHKFCFLCGGKMVWRQENLLICAKCGYRKHINPTPCNAAILENTKGEILLVKRKVDPKKGYWDLPGGFVDLNENVEESVRRELKEELGISVPSLKYFDSQHDTYTYDGVIFPTLGLIFSGKIANQRLIPTDDISGLKFFKPQDLPYERIAFEGLKQALRKFIEIHR